MKTKENRLANFLSVSDEVSNAITQKKPVLALESTVITHGLPSPTNLEVAHELENIARSMGATPATIAILDGKLKIGLTHDEMIQLATHHAEKASVRDLAYCVSQKKTAGTTVALTAFLARMAGIAFFSTGGIGGVHRGDDLDISADLLEISRTAVTIISAGPKAILDIAQTLEVLETYSVPVVGYKTTMIPAFYSCTSQFPAPFTIDTIEELVAFIRTQHNLQIPSGILVMNPIPEADEIPATTIEPMIVAALKKATAQNIRGKKITPFLLSELNQLTQGMSLKTNVSLLKNNVRLGASLATHYYQ